MEALSLLLHGFSVLLTWKLILLMVVGLVLGIFVGVLPGLGGPNGVAILLPLTFTMDPTYRCEPVAIRLRSRADQDVLTRRLKRSIGQGCRRFSPQRTPRQAHVGRASAVGRALARRCRTAGVAPPVSHRRRRSPGSPDGGPRPARYC